MGKEQERAGQHFAQVLEPTDAEKAAAKAARTNRKDRTVWILPSPGAHIYDVWRRGKRWEGERELCLALLEKGIPGSADTDPFFGVDEQYRAFLERIGVRIEETTKPVDFLAGTWSLVKDDIHDF